MTSKEIRLTTSNEKIFNGITTTQIEGINIVGSISFDDISNDFPTLLIAFSSGVAVNLFSNWLYDLLKNANNAEARINGKPVPIDSNKIEVIIKNSVNISVNIHTNKPTQDDSDQSEL